MVCPSTVVGHWINEIHRFFGNEVFSALQYTGSAKKRRQEWIRNLSDHNIFVTSYAVLRNDVEWLSSKRWNYVVLDEVSDDPEDCDTAYFYLLDGASNYLL